jgi:sec-independent protein translocase protein TatA
VNLNLALLPNVGPLEIAIVLVILLIIFGPKRIPAAFRSIGDALRGFRDTVGGDEEGEKDPAALTESTKAEPDKSEPAGPGEAASAESGKAGSKNEV